MKVAIIGPGKIGDALARSSAQAGYDLAVSNSRGPDSLRDLGERTWP